MGETSLTLILPDDLDVNDAQILQRVAAPRRATFGREYGNVTVNIVNSFHSFSPLDVQSHQMGPRIFGEPVQLRTGTHHRPAGAKQWTLGRVVRIGN